MINGKLLKLSTNHGHQKNGQMIAPTIVFFPSNRLIKLENPPSTWCHYWLVVSTPLNKISQLGLIVLFPIYSKTCSKPPTRNNRWYIHLSDLFSSGISHSQPPRSRKPWFTQAAARIGCWSLGSLVSEAWSLDVVGKKSPGNDEKMEVQWWEVMSSSQGLLRFHIVAWFFIHNDS